MKRTLFIISIVASLAFAVSCNNTPAETSETNSESKAQSGAIVYFNLDTILNDYDMANDLRSVVETKVQGINEEVNRRQNKLQKDVNAFQEKVNKGLLTSSVAEVQYANLQQQDQEFQQYAAQKQQEIAEEQAVMMNQLADAIKTFIDEYNEEKGYAMIIATQGDILPAPVVAGNANLDITEDILAGLNEAYVKSKK